MLVQISYTLPERCIFFQFPVKRKNKANTFIYKIHVIGPSGLWAPYASISPQGNHLFPRSFLCWLLAYFIGRNFALIATSPVSHFTVLTTAGLLSHPHAFEDLSLVTGLTLKWFHFFRNIHMLHFWYTAWALQNHKRRKWPKNTVPSMAMGWWHTVGISRHGRWALLPSVYCFRENTSKEWIVIFKAKLWKYLSISITISNCNLLLFIHGCTCVCIYEQRCRRISYPPCPPLLHKSHLRCFIECWWTQ